MDVAVLCVIARGGPFAHSAPLRCRHTSPPCTCDAMCCSEAQGLEAAQSQRHVVRGGAGHCAAVVPGDGRRGIGGPPPPRAPATDGCASRISTAFARHTHTSAGLSGEVAMLEHVDERMHQAIQLQLQHQQLQAGSSPSSEMVLKRAGDGAADRRAAGRAAAEHPARPHVRPRHRLPRQPRCAAPRFLHAGYGIYMSYAHIARA